MIAALCAVVAFVGATPAANPAPSPTSPSITPSSIVIPTTPTRTLVYRVSTVLRLNGLAESYGGGQTAFAPAVGGSIRNHGTATVQIMGKVMGSKLAVNISEMWEGHSQPARFTAIVDPNGIVEMDPSATDEVSLELLPYFGTQFSPVSPLDTSSHWSIGIPGDKSIVTNYAVSAAGDGVVLLKKTQTVRALGSESVDGLIEYNPGILAPIHGQIRKRITQFVDDEALHPLGAEELDSPAVSGQVSGSLDIEFELVSDEESVSARRP